MYRRWNWFGKFLNLQEFADGQQRTAGSDDQSGDREGPRHAGPQGLEGNDGHELEPAETVDGLHDDGVEPPLEEKGQDGPHQAQQHALKDKGPADKPVGGAAHLHDGDLLPPVEGGQFDGVGDDEQGDDQQHGDENEGHGAGHVAQGHKAV